ncbi:MAG: transcription antitermination factor NusB [Candidatus Marinimicrobia bacterium]|nr:transcription antitermination factor NusB [Candidatus Neomarinimicrobiota bacterium]|tara:strand:+ start:1952 stop:2443 length:492 start_codon:yes stop_codon:yes gene_type:complete
MNRIEKRVSRSLSLQIYYAWTMSQTHPNEIINHMKLLLKDQEITDNFYMNGSIIENNESVLNENIIEYSYRLIKSTINKSEEIDELIIKKLKNWDLKRIALIDKLILRLALTEMLFFDDIPHKVSIVEGVEIAKIYGNNESSKFINGVLDSIYNDLINDEIKI